MWPISFRFVFSSAILWMGGNVGEGMEGGSVGDKLGHRTLRNLFPCPSLWGNHSLRKYLSLLIDRKTVAFSSLVLLWKRNLGVQDEHKLWITSHLFSLAAVLCSLNKRTFSFVSSRGGWIAASAWMVPPLGVCFSDQPDDHFRWGGEGMVGPPELCSPRKIQTDWRIVACELP